MKRTLMLALVLFLLALPVPVRADSRAEIAINLDFHHQPQVELQLPPGEPVAQYEALLNQILGPVELIQQSYHLPDEPDIYTYGFCHPMLRGMRKELDLDFSPLADYACSRGLTQALLRIQLPPAENPFRYYITSGDNLQSDGEIAVDLLAAPRLRADIGISLKQGLVWHLPLLLLAAWPFVWAGLTRVRPRLNARRLAAADALVLALALALAVFMGWLDIAEFYWGSSISYAGYLALGIIGSLLGIIVCNVLKSVITHLTAGRRGRKSLPGHLALSLSGVFATAVTAAAVLAAHLLTGWLLALLYITAAAIFAGLMALTQSGLAMFPGTAIAHPCLARYAAKLNMPTPRLLVIEETSLRIPATAFCTRGSIWVQKRFWLRLSEAEREFIIGHEMGHMALGHRAWYIWDRTLLFWTLLLALTVHIWLGISSWLSLPLGGLVFFLALFSARRQRRQYEYQADTIAAWLNGNPAAGVSSLQKAGSHPGKKIAARLRLLKAMAASNVIAKPVLAAMPITCRLSALAYLILPLPALAFWPFLAPIHPLLAWLAMALLFASAHLWHARLQQSRLSAQPEEYEESGQLAQKLGAPTPAIHLFIPKSGVPRAFYRRRRLYISSALWQQLSSDERRFLLAQLVALVKLRLNWWKFVRSQLYPNALVLAFTAHLWLPLNFWLASASALALSFGANRVLQRHVNRLRRRADSAALEVTGNTIAALKALEKTLAGEGCQASPLLNRLQTIIQDKQKEL